MRVANGFRKEDPCPERIFFRQAGTECIKPLFAILKLAFNLRSLIILFFCGLSIAGLIAQSGKGAISGRVADISGAVLQGAQVQLQPQGLAIASDRRGEFSISDLTPGTYTITISYVGFTTFTQELEVGIGKTTRVEAILKVSGKGEEIMVTADRPHGEAEAINRQRTSDNILDVLPADVITSLPNANVADAIAACPVSRWNVMKAKANMCRFAVPNHDSAISPSTASTFLHRRVKSDK